MPSNPNRAARRRRRRRPVEAVIVEGEESTVEPVLEARHGAQSRGVAVLIEVIAVRAGAIIAREDRGARATMDLCEIAVVGALLDLDVVASPTAG